MASNNKGYEPFQNEVQQPAVNPTCQVPQVVVQQPGAPSSTTFVVDASASVIVRWSWCHLVTAVISIFCCTIFGVIATVTSILSYVDHKAKDYERSRNKKNVALGFGIAAIVIGSLGIIITLIAVVVALSHNAGY